MANNFEEDVYKRFEEVDKRLAGFKESMKEAHVEVLRLKENVEGLKIDMANIKTDIANMQKRMDNMQNNIDNMQKRMDTMSGSIVLIEHKVSTEIPALFDGYSLQKEIQGIQQGNITSLNIKVEEHDIRISDLEQAVV